MRGDKTRAKRQAPAAFGGEAVALGWAALVAAVGAAVLLRGDGASAMLGLAPARDDWPLCWWAFLSCVSVLNVVMLRAALRAPRPSPPAPSDEAYVRQMRGCAVVFTAEMFIRISRETEGKALFTWRMFNQDMDELGELFKSKHIFPSLGDAGAHVSQFIDACSSTFVMSHGLREKQLYSIGEGIRRLTSGPARVIGISDRGTLEVGKRADVNVIDFDNVTELHPEIVHDFPGGAPRYIQKARGYKATMINGQLNLLDDELTGAQAGKVLRHNA